MSYFAHSYASNSDIKEIVNRHHGRTKPENIQELYDFGSEFHSGIIEPHKMDKTKITETQVELIDAMSKRFWKDDMCRKIAMMPDFRREHEFYRLKRFGVGARCKTDGDSRKLRIILELKGLSVTTEKAFKDSLLHLDYDQGAAWYLNVASGVNDTVYDAVMLRRYPGMTHYDYKLIVGISKKDPDLLFKMLIDRNHAYYKSGLKKVNYGINIWKNVYGFN
jgi:hypothetical protein